MTLAAMMLTAMTAWAWKGSGTSGDPFLITSNADLNELATNVNNGTTYAKTYFRLEQSLDYGGGSSTSSNYTPIGYGDYYNTFQGHFDGNGKTISGVRVYRSGNSNSDAYIGIFGAACEADIHDLTVSDAIFTGCREVGGIVGYLRDSKLTGCTATNSVYVYANDQYATQNFGGIAGSTSQSSTVSNCVSSATLRKGSNATQYCFGGIVGRNYGKVNGCLAEGADVPTITSSANGNSYGAICGKNDDSGSTGTTTVCCYHNCKVDGIARATGFGVCGADTDGTVAVSIVSGIPDGATVSPAASYTYGGSGYYAQNAAMTISAGTNKAFITFTATGATATLAADKCSASLTVGTSDITVAATLQTIGGSCGDNATWTLAQDGSGNYTRLTVSGTGEMNDYEQTTVNNLWRTTAPWGWQTLTSVTVGDDITSIGDYAFCGCQQLSSIAIGSSVQNIGFASINHCDGLTTVNLPASVNNIEQGAFENCVNLARVNIGKSDGVITGVNAFNRCHTNLVIVLPTPKLALQYKTASNWSAYDTKLRAAFGGQLFTATGTVNDAAYEIANADDLRNFAAAVGSATNYGSGQTFRQTKDIDLSSGGNFPMIGTSSFNGTYDGGEHTISGLTVSGDFNNVGLFGYIDGGTVRNVILISPSVTCTANINLEITVGALAGYCFAANIENCHAVNPTVSADGTGSGAKILGALIGLFRGYGGTATNCYYYGGNQSNAIGNIGTNATVTRVGSAHLVNRADADVTIETEMAADVGFTCDSDGDDTPENYWRTGAQLTLGNNLGEAPEYYALRYDATAGTVSGSTLTVGDQDATVSAAFRSDGQPHTVTYMKADGTTDETSAIALDGHENASYNKVHLAAGTYYVGTDISYACEIVPDGDITLILADGCTMNLANNDYGINRPVKNLTIYGQSLDPATAGTLCYDGTSSLGIYVSNYTQHSGNVSLTSSLSTVARILLADYVTLLGGKLTVSANSENAKAIHATFSVTVAGGQLDATAVGIYVASGDITLGYTNATDHIRASSYSASGTVKIADGQMLADYADATLIYSGTLNDQLIAIAGKTLVPYLPAVTLYDSGIDADGNTAAIAAHDGHPANVTLQGRTLWKDGNWNTLCLPFDVTIADSPLEGDGVDVRTLSTASFSDGTLTLNFTPASGEGAVTTMEAGKPYIIKWTATGQHLTENDLVFQGVKVSNASTTQTFDNGKVQFVGTYNPVDIYSQDHCNLYLGSGNTLYYPEGEDMSEFYINACRAYFHVALGGQYGVRAFVLNFGDEDEETGILSTTDDTDFTDFDDAWYDLSGRKLSGKPSQRGVYIRGGRKIAVQ